MDRTPAFLSDELDLDENQRVGAAEMFRTIGPPNKADLMRCIQRNGKIDGIVESAWLLPMDDYRDVEAAWSVAPVPDRPKIRRRKR